METADKTLFNPLREQTPQSTPKSQKIPDTNVIQLDWSAEQVVEHLKTKGIYKKATRKYINEYHYDNGRLLWAEVLTDKAKAEKRLRRYGAYFHRMVIDDDAFRKFLNSSSLE